ncbi:MAG: D-glycerate dehydrogenase [candidate division KSB1 bacterium]|nr:D-glycerate dehydrogenase [candidate division KSB1 bacterium]MDZ7276564.1 D-glycerate dehydrogenase [candidate division KSB1 bacterium]MDZ7285017.1 D-glycerate dehydrogenase [candidate division KSB1 bacterium]MDZ7298049.1 D-glycerate dehydrogenase [candidate division KSB1 bacterium]MDZ7307437.1 D-glycerate dehydrogenase [candidate division KSB1 bacterium]
MKIYVTRPIPQAGLDLLRAAHPGFEMNHEDRVLTRAELLDRVRGCDGLLTLLTDRIDAELLDAAGPQLKVVANYAVGFDNIDLQAATARGILVTNTPGVLTEATADHAWALLFAIARRIPESERFLRAGKFKGWGPLMFLGGDVTGCTLGIVGAGRIGHAMALRSRGFNMRVLYTDETPNPVLEQEIGARRVPLPELLRESDYVSLHVPLLPGTRHLINADTLRLMKPTAYLINTSRGPVVDEAALAAALRQGRLAGAALDVFENEPAVHPDLLTLENVVLTPHTASATIATRGKMATMAANNLLAGLRGERPPNLVNVEVWGRHRR